MNLDISVVLPTHCPRRDYLVQTLEALRQQTLEVDRWELRVVDNRSDPPLSEWLDISWHPGGTTIREEELGLTPARAAGFKATLAGLIVMVDDDNVLASNYLETAVEIANRFPWLGSWSGHREPVYERNDFHPPRHLEHLVGARRIEKELWSNDVSHHASTPWGSGMCIRRSVASEYLRQLEADPQRKGLDLRGRRRHFGGDTDIAFVGCGLGLGKAVFPQLSLQHLIDSSRCSFDYLVRSAEAHSYSSVIHQFLLDGVIDRGRTDFRGRVARGLRRMLMSRLDRRVSRGEQRGAARALRDIEGLQASGAASGFGLLSG